MKTVTAGLTNIDSHTELTHFLLVKKDLFTGTGFETRAVLIMDNLSNHLTHTSYLLRFV
jgi:hypothetical protein